MRLSKVLLLLAVAGMSGLLSCRSVPPQPLSAEVAADSAGANATMLHRAAQFRQYIAKHGAATGVVLDAKCQGFYAGKSEKLAARCKLLGITEAYIAIPDPEKLADQKALMRKLLYELHRAGVKCYASLELNYLYRYNRDVSLNPFSGSPAARAIAPALSFNCAWGTTAEDCFDGVEGVLLPTRETADKVGRSASLYNWGEKQYGRDGENNIMVRQTLEFMRQIREDSGKLAIIQNVDQDFNDKTCGGKLSGAGVNNFLEFCDAVIVNDVGNDDGAIGEKIATELHNASLKDSVAVRILTPHDFYSEAAMANSFSRKPWLEMVKSLHGVCREANKQPAFRGLVFDDFTGLEALWERTR